MIHEPGHAQADETGQIVHYGVAVLGRCEDRAIAGERVASEGPGPAAETEVELLTRHRILEPASLHVENCDMPRVGLKHHSAAELHRAGVESSGSVETIRQGIDIGEASGQTGTDTPTDFGPQAVPVVPEQLRRDLHADPNRQA
jgi:hypothetical protein